MKFIPGVKLEELKKYIPMIKQHKFIFLAILIIILLVIGGVSYLFITGTYTRMGARYAPEYAPLVGVPYETAYEREVEEKASEILSKPTEYKIKRGSATIKSTNAVSDYDRISQKTESLNGWVETMSKSEDYSKLSIRANLKIPADDFDLFADWLMHSFDVKSANLEFYKVSIERQQDEIQILQLSLNLYDRLLERVEELNVSTESIELIMKITNRKLDVMRLLKSYGYSVEKVEEKAKYASLSVTINQEKKIKLMPEDMGRELRSKLRKSVRDIVNALMDLVTVPITIFVKIIVWIIYAIIVLIPIFIAVKVLLRVFRIIGKKI